MAQSKGFDMPDSVNYTRPVSINAVGMITGNYQDAAGVYRGFLLTL